MAPVVRISIFTIPRDRFDAAAEGMRRGEATLSTSSSWRDSGRFGRGG